MVSLGETTQVAAAPVVAGVGVVVAALVGCVMTDGLVGEPSLHFAVDSACGSGTEHAEGFAPTQLLAVVTHVLSR